MSKPPRRSLDWMGAFSLAGCAKLPQNLPSECLALDRESSALVVGEPGRLAAKLLSEDSVLFLEILDHIELLAVHPASAQ